MFLSVKIHRFFWTALAAVLIAACFCGGTVAAMRQRETESGVPLPIVMYHSVLKEKRRQGNYVVSPDTLESDFAWLKKNGYHAVVVQDLINYVNRRGSLPEKPVMLTFDDGYYNNYCYAYPLAKKWNVKIVVSPVGSYTDLYTSGDADHASYSYLTWGEIEKMVNSGFVEIQNHSYNLHSTRLRYGAKKLPGESVASYQAFLRRDLVKMQDEMMERTGYAPTAFVYPFGAVSRESFPVLRELGFQASMNCMQKTNYLRQDPECLFGLGRYLRPAGCSSQSFFKKIGLK